MPKLAATLAAAATLLLATRAAADPETDRISRQLEAVELVLRAAPMLHLSDEQRARRAEALDRLRAYRERGEFPRNTYAPGRVPVFVDAAGTRCAVGAIAEPDVGAGVISDIAARQRLAVVGAIESPELLRWAAETGLDVAELALIQPTYDDGGGVEVPRDPAHVERAQQWLARDWQRCRNQLYPASIGRGEQKIGTTATFYGRGAKVRARLTLKFIGDGAPARLQRRFERCVKTSFERRRFSRDRDGSLGPWALSSPNYGGAVIRPDGSLNTGAASEYLLHHLPAARRHCGVKTHEPVTARIAADGSYGIEVELAVKRQARCLRRRLERKLRFPDSKDGGTATAR